MSMSVAIYTIYMDSKFAI